MPGFLLLDSAQRYIHFSVGSLEDAGNRFEVTTKPSKVVLFRPGRPDGIELQEDASSTPAPDRWSYSNGYVILGTPISKGEKVVAFVGDVHIFEQTLTQSGNLYFYTDSEAEQDRTKMMRLSLVFVGAGYVAENVTITAEDLLPQGSEATHYQFCADNNGVPSGNWKPSLTSQDIPDLARMYDGWQVDFWVRCVKPKDSPFGTFRDIAIKVEGTFRRLPIYERVLPAGQRIAIQLDFSHSFLFPYVMYVRTGGSGYAAIPIIAETQNGVFLVAGFDGTAQGVLYYCVEELQQSRTYSKTATSTEISENFDTFPSNTLIKHSVVVYTTSNVGVPRYVNDYYALRVTNILSSDGNIALCWTYLPSRFGFDIPLSTLKEEGYFRDGQTNVEIAPYGTLIGTLARRMTVIDYQQHNVYAPVAAVGEKVRTQDVWVGTLWGHCPHHYLVYRFVKML